MKRAVALRFSEAETLGLYRILLDSDKDDAFTFLEDHAKKRLHDFFQSG